MNVKFPVYQFKPWIINDWTYSYLSTNPSQKWIQIGVPVLFCLLTEYGRPRAAPSGPDSNQSPEHAHQRRRAWYWYTVPETSTSFPHWWGIGGNKGWLLFGKYLNIAGPITFTHIQSLIRAICIFIVCTCVCSEVFVLLISFEFNLEGAGWLLKFMKGQKIALHPPVFSRNEGKSGKGKKTKVVIQ